ncbi:MAG: TIGR02757 family protein [Synergistales bacterium]|nr:TIGR02757 family protein [Synergistales bacterium]
MRRYLPVFEEIYRTYNRRDLVSPDPLQFLYQYQDLRSRELVGFIASSLAYGRVQQILTSVSKVLEPLGKEPLDVLMSCSETFMEKNYLGFKHRFTTGREVIALLRSIRQMIRVYGSLEEAIFHKIGIEKNFLSAISSFVEELEVEGGLANSSLLVSPSRNSACKRLFLFLKWMVRKDEVDPGGWGRFKPSDLIMPVDTHVYHISRVLGITRRKTVNLKTALEITEAFRSISPLDPIKYDFALTRFGIRSDMDVCDLFEKCGCKQANVGTSGLK